MEVVVEERDDDPALVGREEELGVLRHAVGAARAGQGRLVVLEGAPGSGKTRLVRAIAAEARSQGMRVVWLPSDGGAIAITAALTDAAAGCALLIVDDGHARGAARAASLVAFGGDVAGLPVLALTTKTELPSRAEQDVWGPGIERHATHVRLRPFRPGTVIALAARMGVGTSVAVLERLHAATGGNALLVVETLAALDRNTAGDEGDPWPLSGRALGWTRARLDALSSDGREVVEVASVLGEECDVGLVVQMAGTSADPASVRAALVESTFTALAHGRASCRFVPPLARDLVYASLPAERRAALHTRAATLLLARGPTSPALSAHRALAAQAAGDARRCEHHLLRLVEEHPSAAGPASPTGWPYFVREGEAWAIGFGDRAIRLNDRVGLLYLARLLSRPGIEFEALALGERSRGRNGLETREPTVAAERARVRVTRRIRDGIDRITQAHPELGAHLDRTIHTGARCSYAVDPASAPRWEVRWST